MKSCSRGSSRTDNCTYCTHLERRSAQFNWSRVRCDKDVTKCRANVSRMHFPYYCTLYMVFGYVRLPGYLVVVLHSFQVLAEIQVNHAPCRWSVSSKVPQQHDTREIVPHVKTSSLGASSKLGCREMTPHAYNFRDGHLQLPNISFGYKLQWCPVILPQKDDVCI